MSREQTDFQNSCLRLLKPLNLDSAGMQILFDLLFIRVISSDALKEFIESLQLLGTIHKLVGEFT